MFGALRAFRHSAPFIKAVEYSFESEHRINDSTDLAAYPSSDLESYRMHLPMSARPVKNSFEKALLWILLQQRINVARGDTLANMLQFQPNDFEIIAQKWCSFIFKALYENENYFQIENQRFYLDDICLKTGTKIQTARLQGSNQSERERWRNTFGVAYERVPQNQVGLFNPLAVQATTQESLFEVVPTVQIPTSINIRAITRKHGMTKMRMTCYELQNMTVQEMCLYNDRFKEYFPGRPFPGAK